MTFASQIEFKGHLTFPEFTGLRIMMMPFRPMAQWRPTVRELVGISTVKHGTAYLTIAEAIVKAGEPHRRPGMHVDGCGVWGGGGVWSKRGMLVASSRVGCRGWHQEFDGAPGKNGDCSHLAEQCSVETVMQAGRVYWCSPLVVHESMPMAETGPRTFVRLSMPNDCPWFDGYTVNPTGVKPTGEVLAARVEFMGYRS
jgi:hypothetical protein